MLHPLLGTAPGWLPQLRSRLYGRWGVGVSGTQKGQLLGQTKTQTLALPIKEKELLPQTQFVHTGYLDAELLAESKKNYGVDLYGPTRADYKWQAREKTGFEAAAFTIDWENEVATCPEGKQSYVLRTYARIVGVGLALWTIAALLGVWGQSAGRIVFFWGTSLILLYAGSGRVNAKGLRTIVGGMSILYVISSGFLLVVWIWLDTPDNEPELPKIFLKATIGIVSFLCARFLPQRDEESERGSKEQPHLTKNPIGKRQG